MNNYNFNTPWESDYWMESNGFFCGLNMVDALKSEENDGQEFSHALPPYNWRSSFLVDEYPSCPENWMRSSGRISSYFVPVKKGNGLWLDFNKNNNHKYHVAIVVSIQGINALTGLPCNDPQLEQYRDECPVHKTPFGHNRLCEKCGFKWPKQNYISTTSTSIDRLWIDGFRAANGVVQQYILTEETMRGVASNIIGKDRVYAIGVSFFLSKNPKPINNDIYKLTPAQEKLNKAFFRNATHLIDQNENNSPYIRDIKWALLSNTPADPDMTITTNHTFDFSFNINKTDNTDCSVYNSNGSKDFPNNIYYCDVKSNSSNNSYNCKRTINNSSLIENENLEIGAGASIDQEIGDDPETLDFWRDKPEALLCINYCSDICCSKIISGGKISLDGHKKSFLKDIPVGN